MPKCITRIIAAVYLYVWTVLGASRFSYLSEHGIIVIATAIARVYFRQAQSATTHRSRHVIIRM